jgi:hypothetical protein
VLQASLAGHAIDVAEVEEATADQASYLIVGGIDAAHGARLGVGDVEDAVEGAQPAWLGEVASKSGPSWIDSAPVPAATPMRPVARSSAQS